MVDLLKLQLESGFYGKCFWCGDLIPPERLLRGADTCKTDCQCNKRKAQRRFQKLVQLYRLIASPTARKLVRAQGRSAPSVSQEVTQ